jgi:ribosomal protein S7
MVRTNPMMNTIANKIIADGKRPNASIIVELLFFNVGTINNNQPIPTTGINCGINRR